MAPRGPSPQVSPCCSRLVIFGAAGDVTSRLFLPSLAQLVECAHLPQPFSILALSRQDWTTDQFHQHVRKRFEDLKIDVSPEIRETLLSMMEYAQVSDVGDHESLQKVLHGAEGPLVFYLALPPSTFHTILHSFEQISLPPDCRIIFEKPFGTDLDSARRLNEMVHHVFPEGHVFRLDHFLGKQTIKNILGLRFANRIFESVWNYQYIERVEIVWEETLTIEGRASYYDQNGALKDMIQNHLLQLLCLIGMEPPISFLNERDFRDKKGELLRSVRRMTPEEVKKYTLRARYDAGIIDGRSVPAYTEEKGVDPERDTETLAEVILWIDSWRWAGVPFVLRSGKALARPNHEIAIYFRHVPHLAFGDSHLGQNVLRLRLSPDSVGLLINLDRSEEQQALQPQALQPFEMKADFAPQTIPPYGQLFLEVLEGNPKFFIRGDEAEELWEIVQPILDMWKTQAVPLLQYPAGSSGPRLQV